MWKKKEGGWGRRMTFFEVQHCLVPKTSSSSHVLFMVRHTHSKLQDRVVYCQGTNSTLQEAISYINGKANGVKLGEKHALAASLLNEFSGKHPNKHTPSQQTAY